MHNILGATILSENVLWGGSLSNYELKCIQIYDSQIGCRFPINEALYIQNGLC